MSNPAFDMSNITVLTPSPIIGLNAELEKFKHLPPYLSVGQAAKLMGITSQGARLLHDRCEMISAGRDELGNRIFRRDGCVAYRWQRMTFGSPQNDNEPSQVWDEA